MNNTENVAILGSTGSIGQSTLAVIDQNMDKYRVFSLCANKDVDGLLGQIAKYRPSYAAMADKASAQELARRVSHEGFETEVLGEKGNALIELAGHAEVDTVVAAIVGSAGLPSTMAAVRAGKKILLANKETLICGGRLFMDAVKNAGATLLPIDSEHNAIFQCLNGDQTGEAVKGVSKIYLTGSGGPFRGQKFSELKSITPDQACAHPNWSMGRKISVDSATMMNKGLELIEACWLFDVEASFIEIVLHPQSIIHSMVEYADGSILAQLGSPDMKTPIAHALAWPERIASGSKPLDLFDKQLSFERPDLENYPCLVFALQAAKSMGSAPLVLNAANEIAVENFLNGQIGYTDIPSVVQDILALANFSEPQSIEEVIEQDNWVRNRSLELVYKMAS